MNDEMNWDAYARHYDEMCELNPAYKNNINLLLERLKRWNLPAQPEICDVGGGTGNYIAALAERLPGAIFTHIDADARMIDKAREKHLSLGIERVRYILGRAQDVDFPPRSFDLVLSANALYAMSPQEEMLRKMRSWLRPSGRLFLIDFGRKQRTLDWTLYVFRESIRSGRVLRYFRALISAREVLKQNRQTTRGQSTGRYWLHTTSEIASVVESSGFEIEEAFACYRGYCDCVVAKPDDGCHAV